ncbi:hypothetical protein BH11MYX2_BH11MYX2_35790 [soil metagenome]
MLRGMPRLVIRIALLSVIASAAACSEDRELSKLQAIRKEVCACTTAACGDAATKKLPSVAPSRVQSASYREQVTARAIVDCLAKLYEQDRPKSEPADGDATTQAAAGSASPTPAVAPVPSPTSPR